MNRDTMTASEREHFGRRLDRILAEIRDNPEMMARIRERAEENRKAQPRG